MAVPAHLHKCITSQLENGLCGVTAAPMLRLHLAQRKQKTKDNGLRRAYDSKETGHLDLSGGEQVAKAHARSAPEGHPHARPCASLGEPALRAEPPQRQVAGLPFPPLIIGHGVADVQKELATLHAHAHMTLPSPLLVAFRGTAEALKELASQRACSPVMHNRVPEKYTHAVLIFRTI